MFFLPYKINRTFKQVRIITITLIITNVLIYFGTASDFQSVVRTSGFVPNIHGLDTSFTSMFLHVDFFSHLLWNMYFLWLFGAMLEEALGKLKFSLIYLTSGLVAGLMHAAIIAVSAPALKSVPLVGASGAIAGLIGVFAVHFYPSTQSTTALAVGEYFLLPSARYARSGQAGLRPYGRGKRYHGLARGAP